MTAAVRKRRAPDMNAKIKRPWCSDPKPMTPGRILEIAGTKGEFTVHRYLYRAEALRGMCQRMQKSGSLRFGGVRGEWLVFRLPAVEPEPRA